MDNKYLIMCLNLAHPSKEHAFFLLEDDEENTQVFDTKEEAKAWIEQAYEGFKNGPFAYSILDTGDFNYE